MKKIQKISVIFVLYLVLFAGFSKVNAASATIKSNKTKMNVGETATITVSVDAAAWNVKVTGEATINEADSSSDGENTKKTFTTSFKATKAGSYDFKLAGDITDGTTLKPQNISGNVKIEVTEKTSNNNNNASTTATTVKKVSSDATLKNLGITPNDFTGFKKTKTSYDVTVPNSTDKITIYAKASNANAKISGTGSKTLKVGSNIFSIKVTAEDKKTTKTYKLNITRKEQDTVEQKEKIDEENEKAEENKEENNEETVAPTNTNLLKNLKIEKYELTPNFDPEVHEYQITIHDNIKSLNIITEKSDENVEIKIDGNNELKIGSNQIIISASNKENGKEQVYKINVTLIEEIIDVTKFNYEAQKVYAGVVKKTWITQGTLGLIAIMAVIFVIAKNIIRRDRDFSEDDDDLEFNNEKESEEFENPYSLYNNQEEPKKEYSKIKSRAKGRRYK